jgi:hypothetical protein
MLIYFSNIDIFSINCVQFNILFEFDIFVLSRLFDMSNTLQYYLVKPPPSVQPDFGVITSLAIN